MHRKKATIKPSVDEVLEDLFQELHFLWQVGRTLVVLYRMPANIKDIDPSMVRLVVEVFWRYIAVGCARVFLDNRRGTISFARLSQDFPSIPKRLPMLGTVKEKHQSFLAEMKQIRDKRVAHSEAGFDLDPPDKSLVMHLDAFLGDIATLLGDVAGIAGRPEFDPDQAEVVGAKLGQCLLTAMESR